MESTVLNDANVDASVNAAHNVTLYAPDGENISVASDKVELWLGRGFSRRPTDLEAVLSEIAPYAAALAPAWEAYLRETQDAGYIPDGAQDAAHAALNMLADACNRLSVGIHHSYDPQRATVDETADDEE